MFDVPGGLETLSIERMKVCRKESVTPAGKKRMCEEARCAPRGTSSVLSVSTAKGLSKRSLAHREHLVRYVGRH